MANIMYDTEQQRFVDRIRATTLNEARDAGSDFITLKWVSKKLRRSIRWGSRNWGKNIEDCTTRFAGGRPEALSQESQIIIASGSEKRQKS